ncbi:unnamed protein product [Ilex paraguariensis]|uniref:Fe2OG dioxygenase domain-containing protein n=1 Tax=Ilex paraguariensis TaxID=185542 RepID=A0ABC8R0W5_9AQUA
MADSAIPTVDLSPFFTDGDEDGKKKAKEVIRQACSDYGFFQVVNHGVPLALMNRAMDLSKTFFAFPDEEKLKCAPPASDAPVPGGYNKQPERSPDKNEYVLMFPPGSSFNVFPTNPPEFQKILEEMFTYFTNTAQLMEIILSDCLGLSPNFLKEYNEDRSWDLMAAMHYFAATDTENTGVSEHEDLNLISFVFQDEIGGLEVQKDGQWIPVPPIQDTLIVNVSDVIQVLSNNRFKSATHRVVRTKGRNRHSFAFFYNLQGDKWVEPLAQFTTEIGEPPKYRGFVYKDYLALRKRNLTHPPSKREDFINITHYSIST